MRKLIKSIVPDSIIQWYKNTRKQKIMHAFKGNQVICPICQSTFSEFGVFGLKKRKNARCHNCGSLERHRLLWKYLEEKTDLFSLKRKIRLLHFAPEKAFYDLFSHNPNIEYFPCDLSPEIYDYKGPVKIFKADITQIQFDNNFFDVILCNHVLEHIPDDRLAMSEMYRVLKNGGWSILQVPIDYDRASTYEDFSITSPAEREKAFGQNDHVRWYGRDYVDRLTNAGFTVREDDFIHSFSEQDIYRFGLMKSELIYRAGK